MIIYSIHIHRYDNFNYDSCVDRIIYSIHIQRYDNLFHTALDKESYDLKSLVFLFLRILDDKFSFVYI